MIKTAKSVPHTQGHVRLGHFGKENMTVNTENTRYGKEGVGGMLADAKKLFFVGIGGINMSSLAVIAASRGYEVAGSDRTRSSVTDDLEARGIRVIHAHAAENVNDADALIYTVSIPTDNPEYVRAGDRGIPRISRADFLGWLMSRDEKRIGVSGMHGKSTCTGMCASILLTADSDPTISSGAVIHELGGTYRAGGDEYFLFEACEYKDSFLSFYPTHAAILNIDMDHPDYFADIEQVKDSFSRYLCLIDDAAVVNWSDANVREAANAAAKAGSRCRLVRFGTSNDAERQPRGEYDVFADDIVLHPHGTDFTLKTREWGELRISLAEAGLHNVRDAAAAAALALSAGITPDDVVRGLASFHGAVRRMELIGKTESGADVYLDYAHHPTEMEATISTARMLGGRLEVIFQPHTYTRTKALFDGFANALAMPDEVVLADIYAAREDDIYGVNSRLLADAVNLAGGHAVYSGDIPGGEGEFERIGEFVCPRVGRGDTVIIMGAGSIDGEARYILS